MSSNEMMSGWEVNGEKEIYKIILSYLFELIFLWRKKPYNLLDYPWIYSYGHVVWLVCVHHSFHIIESKSNERTVVVVVDTVALGWVRIACDGSINFICNISAACFYCKQLHLIIRLRYLLDPRTSTCVCVSLTLVWCHHSVCQFHLIFHFFYRN